MAIYTELVFDNFTAEGYSPDQLTITIKGDHYDRFINQGIAHRKQRVNGARKYNRYSLVEVMTYSITDMETIKQGNVIRMANQAA